MRNVIKLLFFLTMLLPSISYGAMQTVNGSFAFPKVILGHSGGVNYENVLLDATGEKHASVIQCPKTGAIRKIHFRTGPVTTGATVDVRVETVSLTTGDPTGSLLATNTNVSHVINDTDDDAWLTTGNLTADASCTKGDFIAIVIVHPGTGNFNIVDFADSNTDGFPYTDHYTTLWTKRDRAPVMAVEYSDTTFAYTPNVYPISAIETGTFSNASTPDEKAMKFQVPFPTTVTGGWVYVEGDGDFIIRFYDGSNPSTTFDAQVREGSAEALYYFIFPSDITLTKDTDYRVAILPNTGSVIDVPIFNFTSTAVMVATDGGINFSYSERTDANPTWDDVATKRPIMGLFFNAFDDGVGGGGPSTVAEGGEDCFEVSQTVTFETHYYIKNASGKVSSATTGSSRLARFYNADDTLVDTVTDGEFTQVDATNNPGLQTFPFDTGSVVGRGKLVVEGSTTGGPGRKTYVIDIQPAGGCRPSLDANGRVDVAKFNGANVNNLISGRVDVTVGAHQTGEAPIGTTLNPRLGPLEVDPNTFILSQFVEEVISALCNCRDVIVDAAGNTPIPYLQSVEFNGLTDKSYIGDILEYDGQKLEITRFDPVTDTVYLGRGNTWGTTPPVNAEVKHYYGQK